VAEILPTVALPDLTAAAAPKPRTRSGLSRALLSHPVQRFRTDPSFYLKYDSIYFVLCAAFSAALAGAHLRPVLAGVRWTLPLVLVAFPLVVYFLISCHLWIHNATHGNFPRWANRLAGEVLGAIVFVRYASWQIVHLRHHAHSDEPTKDPHPASPSYWASFFRSIITVEGQLQDNYCELWGDTPENRRRERFRAKVSYATNVVLCLAWYLVLGPVGFFGFWVPGNLLAAAFVGHFNWATHNGERGQGFRPVNLDSGRYWLGNRLFTGIYFHANHHHRPHLWNPRKWDASRFGVAESPVDVKGA
jgi:stearoyl-CoA desaturase (delta-9 desaturase)